MLTIQIMKGTRTDEQVLQEEMVTSSNSVSKDDDTEDIPCPWYQCLSLLSVFQFESHCNQHRKSEHTVRGVTSHSHSNRSYSDILINEKYDSSENRSNNQLQRIMSTMPQLSQRSFQDNLDLKSKKILDLIVSFRPKTIREHERESGTDASVLKIKYFCNFCNYKTTTKDALKKHKMCVHKRVKFKKKNKIKFNSNECNIQVTKESQLNIHKMGMHEEVQYNFDKNDNLSRRHGHLTRQKKSLQVKDEHNQCGYRAAQIGKVEFLHLRFQHKCDVCSIQTTTSSNLKRHIQSIHNGIQFNCDKCSYQFTSRGNLKRHLQRVHKEKIYNCDKCASQFTTRGDLKIHVLGYHEGVKYSCDKCVLQYTSKLNLREHILGTHEGLKYNCDQCVSHFSTRSNLRRHKREVHEGVKYICDQCSSHFAARSDLRRHKRNVYEGVKYNCDQCSSHFTARSCLKRHKQRVH